MICSKGGFANNFFPNPKIAEKLQKASFMKPSDKQVIHETCVFFKNLEKILPTTVRMASKNAVWKRVTSPEISKQFLTTYKL